MQIRNAAETSRALYIAERSPEEMRMSLARASLSGIEEIARHMTVMQYTYCKVVLDPQRAAILEEIWKRIHSLDR